MRTTVQVDGAIYHVTMPERGEAGPVSVSMYGIPVGGGYIYCTGRWGSFTIDVMNPCRRRRLMDAIKAEHQKREDGNANRESDGSTGSDPAGNAG